VLLSAVMPLPSAIAGSVLWRVVMIVDEFTCLSACLLPTLIAAGRKTQDAGYIIPRADSRRR
jgi:hypothetical protein